ncbi:MAG TPA: hypothetical protein VGO58_01670, partial [Chitinophagaceae bacterium]|nr:hypothetical protein [Chitinophagaceae bacterium]
MRKKLLFSLFTFFLFFTVTANAQMRNSYTGEEYKECMRFCDRYSNSDEKRECMRGCQNNGFVSVSVKALNQATSLIPQINSKQLKEGENLFYTDKKTGLQYFAMATKEGLVGYHI